MKIGKVLLVFIFALMSVNTAIARGYHGHYDDYGHHRGHHYRSGHRHGHKKHHHYTRREVHYDTVHHDTYREVHHHYNNRDQGKEAAYLIGGIVVGGLIGAALNQSNYNSNYRQPAFVNPYR